MDIKGLNAYITGAGGGIGKQIAISLAKKRNKPRFIWG